MSEERREVVVKDIKMPFWSMVVLLVEWAVAAIPAMIIVYVAAAAVSIALHAIFGSSGEHWWLTPPS